MSKIRKWIVRNFVLGTWIKAFGKTWHTLRAPRVLFPLFVFVGMFITMDPNYPILQWYDFILLGLLAVGVWIGFNFFSWSYFGLYPVKYEEMDDEQKHDFLRAVKSGDLTNSVYKRIIDENGMTVYEFAGGLTKEQEKELKRLTILLEQQYKSKWSGLKSLIPVGITILSVIIWYNFIFPYFN